MKPLYIFDLDGTLALTEHRQHILRDKENPKRWQQFFAASVNDYPHTAVITTMRSLAMFADIWVWSGRSSEVRKITEVWLCHETHFLDGEVASALRMRDLGDFTADEVLKKSWLDDMSAEDKRRLVAVFDDRDKVVKMWRDAGIACFQVAPGDF